MGDTFGTYKEGGGGQGGADFNKSISDAIKRRTQLLKDKGMGGGVGSPGYTYYPEPKPSPTKKPDDN